jgi:glutaconate CoA-transferase subunit B
VHQVLAATGWELAVANEVQVTTAPTADELRVLRALEATKLEA